MEKKKKSATKGHKAANSFHRTIELRCNSEYFTCIETINILNMNIYIHLNDFSDIIAFDIQQSLIFVYSKYR